MTEFKEFELPKPNQLDPDKARDTFPAAAEIIDEFTEIFGEVTVLAVYEGEFGVNTKRNRAIERMPSLTLGEYINLEKMSIENAEYVRRDKKRGGQ